MKLFRLYIVVALVSLTVYTLIVTSRHGWDLLPIFFSNIVDMSWSGQFNFDFTLFLILSGIWVAWRHQFSVFGVCLGVVAIFGGMMFLGSYLLYVSFQSGGDIRTMMLGKNFFHR
jgi:hypothetical protein